MGNNEKEDTNKVDMTDVENGPLTEANRECRDLFCCLLFLACIGGMVYLTIFGYMNGNPSSAFRGVDASANICGNSSFGTSNYPYLYFTNPIYDFTKRICVDQCPTYSSGSVSQVQSNSAAGSTTYTVQYDTSGSVVSGGAPTSSSIIGYDTYLVISRLCMPNSVMFNSLINSTTAASTISQGDLSNFITDTMNNWQYLLAALGWAVVISFVFMFLLRCLAGCIVWCSLFAVIIFFIGLGLIFLYNAGYLGAAAGAATYLGVPSFSSTSANNAVYGWICIGLGCFFFLLTLCCCSRLRLAVAVCKSAGQFVSSVCSSVLVPIFQTILAGVLWAACLVIMVFLVSTTNFKATTSDYFSSISDYSDTSMVKFYCFVFGTLWCSAFIGAMTIFIIASACCMWYYSHGPDQELTLPVSRSYKMVFRY
jgi:solute carrier family 44 protein 1 (choline transporter-like protein)/choline transporter-like protein 2/4/5